LWLDVYCDNARARRAYQALGFVEEGMQRECVWQGGQFRSPVLMSIAGAGIPRDNSPLTPAAFLAPAQSICPHSPQPC
jgi:hypothetical protein